jgi:hypothetical protein
MTDAEADPVESVHEMTDAEAMIARVELLEAKYPRATRVGFVAIDRAFRLINFTLLVIGVITVIRWLI